MPEKINLENLYNTELKPKLSKLDNQRIAIINKIKKYIIISIIPVALSIYFSINFQNPLPTIILAGIFILISFFKINPLWKEYRSQFKEQVISEIIKFIDSSLSYSPTD